MDRIVLRALVALLAIAAASAQERVRCTGGVSFIADPEDLCRYHWCIGIDDPVEMRCAPGSRVPTWFESTSNTRDTPCSMSHMDELSCLRCDYGPDPLLVDADNCLPNPCPAGCECQNQWQSHFCLCAGNVVPTFETVVKVTDFCRPNPCRNGAPCHSQWDDYWCECPRGYTGKNCETPFCGPDTCLNGGTCTVDEINYHCECTRCFSGPCCENQIGNGRDCTPIGPPGVVNPSPTPSTRPPTPPIAPPATTTPGPISCNGCQFGPRCEYTKQWLCECNPCRGGQVCQDQLDPRERICLGKPGPYGSQYTLTFSNDAVTGGRYKRVYVNVGGATISGSHEVRLYTPNIRQGEPCYVDITVTISLNNPAFYDVPAECLNTERDDVESQKVLRVLHLQGQEIVVTVSNMDGDGYLAIPDSMAGVHFVSHTYDKSGYIQYITVVALEDNTQVLIQQPDREVFNFGGVDSAAEESSSVIAYTMNALDSVRYVYSEGDLYGILIVSSKNIHVWTGNYGRVTQKSQEQLATVNRWGPRGSNEYVYIIVGIADSIRNTGDEVHMETAVFTDYTLKRVNTNGEKEDVSRGSVPAQSATVLGQLREGEIFELVTSKPVQVTHNIVGEVDGSSFYSSYALIPSIQQYAQSYSFQTHGWNKFVADNTPKTLSMITNDALNRDDTMTHYLTLVAPRGIIADAPRYLEEIVIYKYNVFDGVSETFSPSDLGARWVLVRGFYYGVRVILPGPGVYYVSNPSTEDYAFCAIYYGVSGRQVSEQPNTAFPVGFRMDEENDIRPPVICNRCMTGPNCQTPVVKTCACNPCEYFDDICEDAVVAGGVRVCKSVVDTTGNPFTLMFMQNRPDNTDKRELEVYVTTAGSTSEVVRVFTPYLNRGDNCYLDMERRIPGMDVALFTIPNPECYETIGSGRFQDKAIRVQSNEGDILVYAINRDEFSADGWVAFPDGAAGTEFFTVCHSPAVYGTEFAVLNIQDTPVTVTLTYTATGKPDLSGTRFTLQPGEVLQIQSQNDKSDLSGTRIQSDRPVNVYSGNIRAKVDLVEDPAVGNINTGSRDHLVEQLMPVSRWGSTFNIVPIPDRRFGDQLKMIGSEDGTACSMLRRQPSGRVTEEQFRIDRGGIFTRDVLSDNSYRVVCDRRVFVSQITKSQEIGFNIHDPSLITIPPVEQYANRYTFNTPSFSGGNGSKRPYRFRLLLISAREEDRDGILIIHRTSNGPLTTRRVSDMGTWVPVPGSDYYNIVAELEVGSSRIVHRRDEVNFMCIFYGYDDRESLGFPIRMRLQRKDASELLSFDSPPPRVEG